MLTSNYVPAPRNLQSNEVIGEGNSIAKETIVTNDFLGLGAIQEKDRR